jgi:hypothetical protein
LPLFVRQPLTLHANTHAPPFSGVPQQAQITPSGPPNPPEAQSSPLRPTRAPTPLTCVSTTLPLPRSPARASLRVYVKANGGVPVKCTANAAGSSPSRRSATPSCMRTDGKGWIRRSRSVTCRLHWASAGSGPGQVMCGEARWGRDPPRLVRDAETADARSEVSLPDRPSSAAATCAFSPVM